MDRVFRIDFYPQDWIVQTGHMTLEQRGIFIQICSLIYANRGPIQNDAAWIGRAANCSPRMARSLIEQLVDNGDIKIQDAKITQKRCESELNKKRTSLELSAKGGRNKAENERDCNENNRLTSSDNVLSLVSTSPTPYPSQESIKPKPVPTAATGSGFLKNGGGRGSLSADAIEAGKRAAPGWDIYFLENQYLEFRTGKPKPDNQIAAFVGWVKKFTKGRSP